MAGVQLWSQSTPLATRQRLGLVFALAIWLAVLLAPSAAAAPSIDRLPSQRFGPERQPLGNAVNGKVVEFRRQPPSAGAIEPYSKHPPGARPYFVCPPPTQTRASCMAVAVPLPEEGELFAGFDENGEPLPVPAFQGSGVNGGFSPENLRSAYALSGSGEGMTVAITVAYDYPKAEADLSTYRAQYGLTACTTANGCFKKLNQNGEAKNYPPANRGWASEAALDLDMVSAACPKCNIILIEANDPSLEDLGVAVERAGTLGATVISDSWATPDFSGSKSYNSYFDNLGVPVLFASGDSGYGPEYPAASPDVVAVGGTSLFKSVNARGWFESAWSGAGSGCAISQNKPVWQKDEACSKRSIADVSAIADPTTPVSAYDSYESPGWMLFGGTSVATPFLAGVEALSSASFRMAGPSAFTRVGLAGAFNDPTSGENGNCDSYLCVAKPGYDGPSGWGTPNGVPALPVAITEQPTVNSTTKAILRGSINPGGLKTEYHFEYGTSESYGTSIPIPDSSVGSGTEYVEVSQALEGLKGQTTYHYRITATNANGTFHGVDRAFSTTAPAATTGSASAVQSFRADVSGVVNPEASRTAYFFEYGLTTSYGHKLPIGGGKELEAGATDVAVITSLTGLSGHRTYHYRLVASNIAGRTNGEDRTFTTSAAEWAVQKLPKPEAASAPVETFATSCVRRDSCVAVGDYWDSKVVHDRVTLAEYWNGGAWSTMSTPNPSGLDYEHGRFATLRGVSCASESDCIAVGYYKDTSELFQPLAERWNGSSWSMISISAPSGATGTWLEDVSCTSSSQCTVVGYYKTSSGVEAALAERWNGTSWSIQSTPNPQTASATRLRGVSCASSSWCSAVGFFHDSTEKQENGVEKTKTLALRWDGNSWAIQPSPNVTSSWSTFLAAVSCTSATQCSAVGGYSFGSGFSLAEGWNGSEWTIQSTPSPNGNATLESVSCTSSTSCTAVGSTRVSATDPGSRALAERWSGSTWSRLEIPEYPAPEGWWHESKLRSVSCVNATDCTAVGTGIQGQQGQFAGEFSIAEQTVKLAKATTEKASGIKKNEATVYASINPEGAATTYYVEYGTSTAYGANLPLTPASVGWGTSAVAVNQALTGLSLNTTYHYRVVAENAAGVSEGEDKEFTTLTGKPLISGETATNVNSNNATLNAVVNPNETATAYHFEYDTSEYKEGGTLHGTSVPVPDENVGSGSLDVGVSQKLGGLTPYTTYHYRVVAANKFGTTYGEDRSFYTGQWSTQTTRNPEPQNEAGLEGVSCASSTMCLAAGNDGYSKESFAELWNGTEWEMAIKRMTSTPHAIACTSTTSCIAVGQSGSGSSSTAAAERWYYSGVFGVKWTNVIQSPASPSGGVEVRLNDVSCTSESACTAVGSYWKEAKTKTLAERYNGSTWSIQTTPNPESGSAQLLGVSCASATSCKAVGKREGETFAESWNGSEWTIVSTPNPAGTERRLEKVSCSSTSACMAVGSYTPSGEPRKAFAESWNGSEWSVLTVPKPAAAKGTVELSGVSCPSASACYAAGKYVSSEGIPVEEKTLAETWNGSAWAVQTSTNPEGRTLNALKGVSCTSTSACTAVGSAAKSSSDKVTLGERWG